MVEIGPSAQHPWDTGERHQRREPAEHELRRRVVGTAGGVGAPRARDWTKANATMLKAEPHEDALGELVDVPELGAPGTVRCS